jgi:allophanate hydrolase subunit 1
MDLCWYNNSPGDIGWGRIGRFTFSGDAVGKWTLAVMQAGDDVRYVFGGKIIHGKLQRDGF